MVLFSIFNRNCRNFWREIEYGANSDKSFDNFYRKVPYFIFYFCIKNSACSLKKADKSRKLAQKSRCLRYNEKLSNPTNFIKFFSTCLKLRQLLEKDTKLEIENKSSPFVPIVNKEPHNPETPLVQIDSKKEASSKVSFRASFQQIYSFL